MRWVAAVLVLLVACGGGEEEAQPTTTERTTTTERVTTTRPTTTTSTTEVQLTAEEWQEIYAQVFENSGRQPVIDLLTESREVETVDKVAFENGTVVIAVTSRWASPDNQHEGAWSITREVAELWNVDSLDPEVWLPAYQLTNSGRVYSCTGSFMYDLARVRASQADWESLCA